MNLLLNSTIIKLPSKEVNELYFIFSNLIFFIVGYLVGSLIFGYIIGKLVFRQDIRELGSKSSGATNVRRSFGWKYSVIVMLLDTLKTYILLWILATLVMHVTFFAHANLFIAAIGTLLGHAFPVYFKFKGGKCSSTFYGMLAFYNPIFFVISPVIYWTILLITKYSSLGSLISLTASNLIAIICLSLSVPFIGHAFVDAVLSIHTDFKLTIMSLVVANFLLLLLHSKNITSLINKTENKIVI